MSMAFVHPGWMLLLTSPNEGAVVSLDGSLGLLVCVCVCVSGLRLRMGLCNA
jgi:hypothetical protein